MQVSLRTFHISVGRAKMPLTSKKSWVFFSRCLSSVNSRKFCFSVCWFWLASSSSASSFSSTVCLGSKHIQKNSEANQWLIPKLIPNLKQQFHLVFCPRENTKIFNKHFDKHFFYEDIHQCQCIIFPLQTFPDGCVVFLWHWSSDGPDPSTG